MLDYEDVTSGSVLDVVQDLANHVGCRKSLFDVEVGRGFVEHVDVGVLYGHGGDGESVLSDGRKRKCGSVGEI